MAFRACVPNILIVAEVCSDECANPSRLKGLKVFEDAVPVYRRRVVYTLISRTEDIG